MSGPCSCFINLPRRHKIGVSAFKFDCAQLQCNITLATSGKFSATGSIIAMPKLEVADSAPNSYCSAPEFVKDRAFEKIGDPASSIPCNILKGANSGHNYDEKSFLFE